MRCRWKSGAQRRDPAADVLERADLDAGASAARIVAVGGALEPCPAAVEPVGLVGAVVLRGFKFRVEAAAPVGLHLLDFALGDHALADEPVGVDFQRAGMVGDGLVHQRLGERGLVALVVAVAPVAEHVDHDRLLEFLPEFGRDLGREHDRLRIVAVDVEDRRLDHLGDVGGIRRRARIARIGGEADLIVDDEMQRAAGAVTAQPRKPEALRDHALPGERGVAVDQERHHADAVLAAYTDADPAWRAPCRARPGRRFPDARDWRSATDAPCCCRTHGPTRRRDGISRRRSLRPRSGSMSRP